MSNTVLVGCKLPSGITLDGSAGQRVELNGVNTSMVAGGCGLTHVDATEWLYLQAVYAEHSTFKTNQVFSYKDSAKVADVLDIAADLADVKNGFEGLDPNAPAKAIVPEDASKLKQELRKNEGVKAPAKVAKSKADQAAAVQAATGG